MATDTEAFRADSAQQVDEYVKDGCDKFYRDDEQNLLHETKRFSYLRTQEAVREYGGSTEKCRKGTERSISPANEQTFHPFSRLPTELQSQIWAEAAKEAMSRPQIVELHEKRIRVSYTWAHDASHGPEEIKECNITHFDSTTKTPGIFTVGVAATAECWKHKFVHHIIPFNFSCDAAYFTEETMNSWMQLCKRYAAWDWPSDVPFGEGARLSLANNLQHVVIDTRVLMVTTHQSQLFHIPRTELSILTALKLQQLAAVLVHHVALKQITLVVPAANGDEDREGESHDKIELVDPGEGSQEDAKLQLVASHLRRMLSLHRFIWGSRSNMSGPADHKKRKEKSVPPTHKKIMKLRYYQD